MTAGASFALAALAYPPYIAWLKEKQVQQFIREDGPQSHIKKEKTPTMGGLCFIFSTAVCASLFLLAAYQTIEWRSLLTAFIVLAIAVLCGLVGFVDDFGKITSKSNRGISGFVRLGIEFALGLVLGLSLYFLSLPIGNLVIGVGVDPIVLGQWETLVVAIFLSPFLVAATSNSLNLHDGMDGLAAGTSVQVFATLCLMLYSIGQPALACIAAAICGALLAFLLFNRYPAKIFMGDTGSLFIGALLAALVVASGLTLWLIPLALIYIVETLSVMMQVAYFKLTKPYKPEKPSSALQICFLKLTRRLPGEGKRLFRMAPIHHHFEAVGAEKGVPEWHVVCWFWLCQLAVCLACCLLFWHHARGGQ